PVEPGVNGLGRPRLEQAVAGDRMRRHPRRDLEQGRTAFAHPGTPVVVTMVFQLLALRLRQAQSSAWGHHTLLSPVPQDLTLLLPILFVKTHKAIRFIPRLKAWAFSESLFVSGTFVVRVVVWSAKR